MQVPLSLATSQLQRETEVTFLFGGESIIFRADPVVFPSFDISKVSDNIDPLVIGLHVVERAYTELHEDFGTSYTSSRNHKPHQKIYYFGERVFLKGSRLPEELQETLGQKHGSHLQYSDCQGFVLLRDGRIEKLHGDETVINLKSKQILYDTEIKVEAKQRKAPRVWKPNRLAL